MDAIIMLLVYLLIFCAIGWGAWWICVKFGMPQPVMWVVGAILLIILLLAAAHQIGGAPMHFPTLKN